MNTIGLSGSPTAVSRSSWLLRRFLGKLDAAHSVHTQHSAHVLSIRDLPAQALLHADTGDVALSQALAQVDRADTVVIATPIYKAAYSGLLKVFLDLLPQDGLKGKSVVVLATGGSTAHLLAVEYALKPVLSALGARQILDTVYATDAQLPRHEALGFVCTAEIDARLDRAASAVQPHTPLTRQPGASPQAVPWQGVSLSSSLSTLSPPVAAPLGA